MTAQTNAPPDPQPGSTAAAPLDGPRLLTVTEACAALRISRWLFYRLVRQHRVRTIKIGSRRLVPAGALDELLARLQHGERLP
jgi:excisionase family DNA binding protein